MRALTPTTRPYTAVILKAGPNRHADGVEAIIWEHGRRNFSLRADGLLAIVCPVADGCDVNGVGIFNLDPDQTSKVMDGDPDVQAGVLSMRPTRVAAFPATACQGSPDCLTPPREVSGHAAPATPPTGQLSSPWPTGSPRVGIAVLTVPTLGRPPARQTTGRWRVPGDGARRRCRAHRHRRRPPTATRPRRPDEPPRSEPVDGGDTVVSEWLREVILRIRGGCRKTFQM